MAIVFDNSSKTDQGSASSITLSHTCSTGDNRIIFAFAYWNTSRTVSSCKYNNVDMTLVALNTLASGEFSAIYYLVAPATGANNIVLTLSGTTSIELFGISYTGVAQTSPIDAHREETALETGTTYAEALTTTTNDCFIIWGTREYAGRTITAGANTTLYQRGTVQFGGIIAATTAGQGLAGSKTLNLNANASGNWYSDILVSFKPYVVTTSIKTFKGLAYASVKTVKGLAIASVKTKKGLA